MGEPRYGEKCFKCSHIRHDTPCSECSFCRVEELLRLVMAREDIDLFGPNVKAAVKAFHAGEDHPLLDQLRAECQAEEDALGDLLVELADREGEPDEGLVEQARIALTEENGKKVIDAAVRSLLSSRRTTVSRSLLCEHPDCACPPLDGPCDPEAVTEEDDRG